MARADLGQLAGIRVQTTLFRSAVAYARPLIAFACALIIWVASGVSAGLAQEAPLTERRVALIIGNGVYKHVETLANPTNDSAAMRDRLSELGFETFGGDNLTREEFLKTLADFAVQAKTAKTVLVYYSGHGFQLNGRNYLVPSDAMLKTASAIEAETVRLDHIIRDLQGADRQLLVFLDACRNNPLPPSQRQSNGLAQVETGGDGVFVAFATQPGNISYDGRSKLSPFTRAITLEVDKRGQDLPNMMMNVRNEVRKQTLRQQTPWEQSSLTTQFYFSPGARTDAPTVAALDLGLPGDDTATQQRSTGIEEAVKESLATQQPNVLMAPTIDGSHSNVILLPEAPIEVFGREDLVLGVQTELQRIGCYPGEVDGLWSKTSAEALSRYFAAKKFRDPKTPPADGDLDVLKREMGRVCKLPQAERRYNPPARNNATERRSVRNNRNAAPARENRRFSASPSPARPAGPPPREITNTRMLGAFR